MQAERTASYVLMSKDETVIVPSPGLGFYHKHFQGGIIGEETCPRCGKSAPYAYQLNEAERKRSILVVSADCPFCRNRWEYEAEMGVNCERATPQRLDKLARKYRYALGVEP